MRRLDNRMREAFDQDHASQELKARTRTQVLQAMEAQRKPARAV